MGYVKGAQEQTGNLPVDKVGQFEQQNTLLLDYSLKNKIPTRPY